MKPGRRQRGRHRDCSGFASRDAGLTFSITDLNSLGSGDSFHRQNHPPGDHRLPGGSPLAPQQVLFCVKLKFLPPGADSRYDEVRSRRCGRLSHFRGRKGIARGRSMPLLRWRFAPGRLRVGCLGPGTCAGRMAARFVCRWGAKRAACCHFSTPGRWSGVCLGTASASEGERCGRGESAGAVTFLLQSAEVLSS
jgi:hypothetical protein